MAVDVEENVSFNGNGGGEDHRETIDGPPVDDCCPICFEAFNLPCRTSCGHWYCANCILQYWNFGSSMRKCKCPMCSRLINKITPEASLLGKQEEQVVKALNKIQQYNNFYDGGVYGFFLRYASPVFFKRFLQELTNPENLAQNIHRTRVFACSMGILIRLAYFQLFPSGADTVGFKLVTFQTRLDLWLCSLVFILYIVGVCRQWLLRRRIRSLADEVLYIRDV